MTTLKLWRGGLIGFIIVGTAGLVSFIPNRHHDETFAQDQVLVSAATDLHPTVVFSINQPVNSLPEAFRGAGLDYHPEDKISAFPKPENGLGFALGTVVTDQRALPITIIDGKRQTLVRTWTNTVGELFTEKKIELGNDDTVAPTLLTPLAGNMTVKITRVARTNVTETEVIPYQTTIDKDYSQFVGGQTIVKAGQNGQLAKTYLLIREDGELVSKTLVSTKTITAPVTQVVKQGGLNPVPSQCLSLKDWVVDASLKNGLNPNDLFYRIVRESNCHPTSSGQGGQHLGLLQYDPGFWASISAKAGYPGGDIWNAKTQIYVTAYAWSHGLRGRWSQP